MVRYLPAIALLVGCAHGSVCTAPAKPPVELTQAFQPSVRPTFTPMGSICLTDAEARKLQVFTLELYGRFDECRSYAESQQ